jgi:hypothetical protein
LVKETGLFDDFDEHNYRKNDSGGIHCEWGQALVEKFKSHYKEPWLVMLHLWELHTPRRIIKECRNKKCGITPYARALSGIDSYLSRLFSAVNENTIICVVARAGSDKPTIKAGTIKDLINQDFGLPLHTIVIPGKLHFMEIEALQVLAQPPAQIGEKLQKI